jgi:MFS family permease
MEEKLDSKTNYPKKLFNKNYLLLWQGQSVSRLGSQMYYMAMVIWITNQTGSASLLALMGIIGAIPALLFTSIGGTFADRFSRKKIIILSDILKGLAILSLAYLFYFHSGSTQLIITWLMVVVAFSSIVQSFFTPAISAVLPELVPKDKLATANTLGQSSIQISQIIGWSLSSTLYFIIGIPLLTLINGITFIFSAISEVFIKFPKKKSELSNNKEKKVNSFKAEFKEGISYVWKDNGLKKLILASVFITFFSTPIVLLLPFYLKVILQINESYLGILFSINAVGILIGSVLASLFKGIGGGKAKVIILFMMLNAINPIILGLMDNVIFASIFLFLGGLWAGFIQVNIRTIMQLRTESNIRGRVFGVVGTLAGALTPIAMAFSGIIADLTDKNIPLIYGSSGVIMIIITIIVWFSKDIREFLTITKKDLLANNA